MDTTETLRYDRWIEDALKGVVRRALTHCQEHGLPGDHHFYITFATDHPDVSMPEHLKAQYPREITVVLEHEYWDLNVGEDAFDVSLSFNDIRSPLHIPFETITGFADPSVKFGLQFKMDMLDDEFEDEIDDLEEDDLPASSTSAPASEKGDTSDNVVTLDAFRNKK